jgi:rhomboid family GlyGly-CTERM serine protease
MALPLGNGTVNSAKKTREIAVRSWATLAIAAAAGLTFASPRLAGALIYERADILAGQVWRLWTGHLVHYSPSHLWLDLAVFVAAGAWLEWIAPRLVRWFYVLAPPAISAVLLLGDPTLEHYAGLSGVATGLLVLLALVQLRRNASEPRWFWFGVLLLVAAKIVVEVTVRAPLFARFDAGVRVVPLAHVGGLACALIAFLVASRRTGPSAG